MGWIKRFFGRSTDKRSGSPAERWNRFLDQYCMLDLQDVDADHVPPYLFYRYFSEVYNGGHLQFFLNCERLPMAQVSGAIGEVLGAEAMKNFDDALAVWRSWDPARPETAQEFVDLAKEATLDAHDSFIYRIEPSMEERLMSHMIERRLI